MSKINIDKDKIEILVKEQEDQTTGEIVPVLLKSSDLYPASHFRLAILLGLTTGMTMYLLPITIEDPIWYLWGQIPAMIIGYLLAYHHKVKRLFSTRYELKEEVYQRAVQAFIENGVHTTSDRNGVLIFISFLEKKIEIMADKGIHEKVELEVWPNLVKDLGQSIKEGQIQAGLEKAITEVGSLLCQHYPKNADQQPVNQLPNNLVTEE